jgi:hypothetical protein
MVESDNLIDNTLFMNLDNVDNKINVYDEISLNESINNNKKIILDLIKWSFN